jgi:hypothetical protein
MTLDVIPATESAGGSAEQRYDGMVKSWRSSHLMRRIRLISLGLGVLFMVAGAKTGDALAFNLGALAGACFTFWFAVRDLAVPEYIERWGRGAEGEKRTGKELNRLGADWHVRHDLAGRFGNVDHMLIGPAGVLLLDTKTWVHGTTTVTASGPIVAARHDEECTWTWERLPARMRGAAAGASDGLRALTARRIHVRPVVVIWGDFPGRVQERGGVTYIAGEHLVEWLTALPARLTHQERASLERLT